MYKVIDGNGYTLSVKNVEQETLERKYKYYGLLKVDDVQKLAEEEAQPLETVSTM